jgi:hypothetical protein
MRYRARLPMMVLTTHHRMSNSHKLARDDYFLVSCKDIAR